MEPEDGFGSARQRGRVMRAVALMAVSLLAIGIATVSFARPELPAGSGSQPAATTVRDASYRLMAIDFVNPSTGWVLAESTLDFAILRTVDGGRRWSRELASPVGQVGEYMRFFDQSHGVIAVLGPQAQMFQTGDGGKTWSSRRLEEGSGYVVSATFIDARHGWLLAATFGAGGSKTHDVFRTSDGGVTWSALGTPVLATDMAYRVVFTDPDRGWLYSRSSGVYAYRTSDGGVNWRRIALPAPHGSWPVAPAGAARPEQYFVAARPTSGEGVEASVISIAPPEGRSAAGGTMTAYPPLTVHGFDGGRPVTFIYSMSGDTGPSRFSGSALSARPGPVVTAPAENEVVLTSIDDGRSWSPVSAPSPRGAVGYLDALNWWWIGSGSWSKSSDAGKTWTSIRNLGVPEPLPGSLQLLDASHAWFGGMAGARPLLESTGDGGVHWTMYLLPPITP